MKNAYLLALAVLISAGCHRTIEFGTRHQRFEDPNTTPIVVDEPVLMRFAENQHDFRVLQGGGFDKRGPGRLIIHNSIVQILIQAGWAYVVGDYPFAETPTTTIGATGTTFAVEIGSGVERIYLLNSKPRKGITVQLKPGVPSPPGAPRQRVLIEQGYVEIRIGPGGVATMSDRRPIKGDADRAGFIDNINAKRKAANLEGWPANLP